VPPTHSLCNLPSVHPARQCHVTDEQINRSAGLYQSERRGATIGLKYPVPEVAQLLCGHFSDVCLIFDQQQRFSNFRYRGCLAVFALTVGRKAQTDRGPLAN
jgi:hypothetical protein